MKNPIDFAITVDVSDRASMESKIDEAVSIAKARAMQDGRRGILVSRNDFGCFTVALRDAVPFGLTLEAQNL